MTKKNNLQEIFDTVYQGLKQQDFKKSLGRLSCMYRNEDGLRCAAGHLIPDQKYRVEMENVISKLLPYFKQHYNEVELNFIQRLQDAHDFSKSPEIMAHNLYVIAAKENIECQLG